MSDAVNKRGPPVLLCVVYLVLLWAVSGIAMHKGLFLFGLGVAALSLALWKYHRGRQYILYRAFFAVLLAGTTVLGIEAVLFLFPDVVTGRLANYTFSGYHQDRGGIFRPHAHMGSEMKPGLRRRMYWNGHWWTHETNKDGYRGPAVTAAHAVFLGDSLIYGHGVEALQTVPAQFGSLTGRSVANLGQQGIGSVQSLVLFREKGARLQPRAVYVCIHPGDVQDTIDVYETAELQHFLEEAQDLPLARPELRDPKPFDLSDWWSQKVALPLRAARLLSGIRGKPDWVLQARAPDRRDRRIGSPYVPPPEEREASYPALDRNAQPALRLGWQANRHALVEIQRLASRWGGRVIVFDLGYPRAFTEGVETMVRELGMSYSPAGREVLARAIGGAPMYLANDGHWTRAGSAAIASALAGTSR